MDSFCETCPDQNTFDCKLISRKDLAAQGIKILIATAIEGISSVGYASGPVVYPENNSILTRFKTEKLVREDTLKTCIISHSSVV